MSSGMLDAGALRAERVERAELWRWSSLGRERSKKEEAAFPILSGYTVPQTCAPHGSLRLWHAARRGILKVVDVLIVHGRDHGNGHARIEPILRGYHPHVCRGR